MMLRIGKIYRVKNFAGTKFYFKDCVSAKEIETGDIFTVIAYPNTVRIPKHADPDTSTWYDILHSDGQVYALWAPKGKDFLEEV